jgi:hypothetical protein
MSTMPSHPELRFRYGAIWPKEELANRLVHYLNGTVYGEIRLKVLKEVLCEDEYLLYILAGCVRSV